MTTLTPLTRSTRLVFLLALAAGAGSPALAAQQPQGARPAPPSFAFPPAAGTSSGWLGMQISGPGDGNVWTIDRVVPGSPAEDAGVREGDRLIALNGTPASAEALSRLTRDLEPGEAVRVRLEREGRTLDLNLVAQERPLMVVSRPGTREIVVLRPDSIRGLLRLRADSLPRFPSLDSLFLRGPGISIEIDTIRLREFRDREWGEAMREWEGYFRRGPGDSVSGPTPRILLRREGDSLGSWRSWPPRGEGFEPGERGVIAFRSDVPNAFYWTGQRVVAGAEVTPVNEGLSTYFGVDRGLLVVDVVEESPAARAGMRAGDVVLRVESQDVDTVEAFRSALTVAYRSPPVRVELLRDGSRVTLEITR